MTTRETQESSPSLILLATHGDTDMLSLSRALSARGVSNLSWSYDGVDTQFSAELSPGNFRLAREGEIFPSEHLERTRGVIYRLGFGMLDQPVRSSKGPSVERAWARIINGVLFEAEYRHPKLFWVNQPSANALATEKAALLLSANLDGFATPSFRISTENLLPPSRSGEYVGKAISEVEDIDDQTTFPTTPLPQELIDQMPFRTDTPSLIQERIKREYELRIYYLLGETLSIQTRVNAQDYNDLRFVPREDLSIKRVDTSLDLEEKIRKFCDRRNLSYCVFEFLPSEGEHLLIDVNHNGSWSHFESAQNPFITEWAANTLAKQVDKS